MSDIREALARLLMDWGCDDESAGRCADEILAEFLVVPHADIAPDGIWSRAERSPIPLPENGDTE